MDIVKVKQTSRTHARGKQKNYKINYGENKQIKLRLFTGFSTVCILFVTEIFFSFTGCCVPMSVLFEDINDTEK